MMQIDINELIGLVKSVKPMFLNHTEAEHVTVKVLRRFRDTGRYPCAGIYAKGTVKALTRGTVYGRGKGQQQH